MKCLYCGQELNPNAQFCTNCGAAVVRSDENDFNNEYNAQPEYNTTENLNQEPGYNTNYNPSYNPGYDNRPPEYRQKSNNNNVLLIAVICVIIICIICSVIVGITLFKNLGN